MPLKLWMKAKGDLFLIGPIVEQEWVAWLMAWGGFLLDFTIAFFLLSKRTRKGAFVFVVLFHLSNHLIFNIGIFPYLSVAITALFFGPRWPRQFVAYLEQKWARVQRWSTQWQSRMETIPPTPTGFWQGSPRWRPVLLSSFVLLILIHSFLPLRHWLFPGDVAWTADGHRYAWRMMLRSKRGRGHFIIKNLQTGEEERIRPKTELLPKQARKLWTHPDMILQYAHHLRDRELAQGNEVAVFAHIRVKLNDGMYHPYVDSERDLAQVEWSYFRSSDWLLPEGE